MTNNPLTSELKNKVQELVRLENEYSTAASDWEAKADQAYESEDRDNYMKYSRLEQYCSDVAAAHRVNLLNLETACKNFLKTDEYNNSRFESHRERLEASYPELAS